MNRLATTTQTITHDRSAGRLGPAALGAGALLALGLA